MNVLGISAYFHDSAVCLLQNGRLVMHVEEERLNREKHTARFPELALEACLREGGITIADVDAVAFNWDVFHGMIAKTKLLLRHLPGSIKLLRPEANPHGSGKAHFQGASLRRHLVRRYGLPRKVAFFWVNHHHTHAAAAFLGSPFPQAGILTLDAVGDDCATATFVGNENRITPLAKHPLLDSLGILYSVMTEYLGFRTLFDEGKVMALAALGTPSYLDEFRRVVRLNGSGTYKLDLSYFKFQSAGEIEPFSQKFYAIFGPPRTAGAPLDRRCCDIAASLQSRVEEVVLAIAADLHRKVGSDNLCMAGGVALNCICNGRLLREGPFRNLFIPPVPNDSGGALGAALWVYHCIYGHPRSLDLGHAYWGPEYGDDEVERVLAAHGLCPEKVTDAPARGAQFIADGGILGWFQGRMEIGPRALGHRSILADPRRPEMKDILNERIKHRETFRPFAPAVLAEEAHKYFDLRQSSPFMCIAASVRPEKRSTIPAVVHVDGSARVQTVRREDSPRFWALIKEFERRTGVPVVLNTSFNENEPIVCSPTDAVRCYLRTAMDHLIIGDYVLEKKAHAL